MTTPSGLVISILGAESTGKTTLAAQLADALRADGHRVAMVDEYLRTFCAQAGRTPLQHEQLDIAQTQTARIDEARSTHDVVVADTTALMTAVYSEWVFGDRSLYPMALLAQQGYAVTLLSSLDLPWEPDATIRDGPHARAPVDAMLRRALADANIGYSVVAGQGESRTAMALAAVRHAMAAAQHRETAARQPRWHWACDRCGDTDCERHWLARERPTQHS